MWGEDTWKRKCEGGDRIWKVGGGRGRSSQGWDKRRMKHFTSYPFFPPLPPPPPPSPSHLFTFHAHFLPCSFPLFLTTSFPIPLLSPSFLPSFLPFFLPSFLPSASLLPPLCSCCLAPLPLAGWVLAAPCRQAFASLGSFLCVRFLSSSRTRKVVVPLWVVMVMVVMLWGS